jgi:hypothetical protein
MLSVESLKIMYETNYGLIESKIFSLDVLENMIPWERRVYIGLYIKSLEEQKERIRQAQMKNKKVVRG